PSRHEQITRAVESKSAKSLSQHGGKDASRSVWREFIDDAISYHKKISRVVTGQSIRGAQSGGKDAPDPTWCELIDGQCSAIRHKKISRAVKSQCIRMLQPGREGTLRSVGPNLEDCAVTVGWHK